jgi:hypothetical protein
MHGRRHAYAQERFLELTGFACPAAGGPTRAELTPAQREADYDARLVLSAALGHGREAITAAYLGRWQAVPQTPPQPPLRQLGLKMTGFSRVKSCPFDGRSIAQHAMVYYIR